MAKRQQPGCGCCGGGGGGCTTTCSPCDIPTQDLTLTKTPGPTVSTLVYNSTGPTWSDGSYTFQCSAGTATLTGPGGPWAYTVSNCTAWSIQFGAGAVLSTITGGDPSGSICCHTFNVKGCFSNPLPGASVKIYDASGGTLLTSGTTNSAGKVTLLWTKASSPCTVWVDVSYATRFATDASTRVLTSGGSTDITLSPATGYFCPYPFTSCVLPWSETLTMTNSVIGSNTATKSGSVITWSVAYAWNRPGGCSSIFCGAVTITWSVSWNVSTGIFGESWHAVNPALGQCPDDAQPGVTTVNFSPTPTCTVPVSWTHTRASTATCETGPGGAFTPLAVMYGLSARTITVTE